MGSNEKYDRELWSFRRNLLPILNSKSALALLLFDLGIVLVVHGNLGFHWAFICSIVLLLALDTHFGHPFPKLIESSMMDDLSDDSASRLQGFAGDGHNENATFTYEMETDTPAAADPRSHRSRQLTSQRR